MFQDLWSPSKGSIDNLLKSSSCTLEKLLDDPDCVLEARNDNGELIKYLSYPENLQLLINYITEAPFENQVKVVN